MPESVRSTHPVARQRIVRAVWMMIAAVLAAMTIFPLLNMVSIAFKDQGQVFDMNLIPVAPTMANFLYVFTKFNFIRYLFNSFVVSSAITIIALLFHSMAGYALARLRMPGREIIFMTMLSTFLVSLPVIIIPLFVLVRFLGLLNSYSGLIIPPIFNAFGIFLLRQYYLTFPYELEEAALIDGAGYWFIYWRIILPLSKPILSSLAILFFLTNWNAFIWPLTVTSDKNLWVVQVAISTFRGEHAASWNYIMAASTVVALPIMIIFAVFQRQIMESIKTGGLK
jgi:multiple sugar transport system permease protein